MTKIKKLLFVQKAVGRVSETFLTRLINEIKLFDLHILSGKIENINSINPKKREKIHLWSKKNIFFDRVITKIFRIFNLNYSISPFEKQLIRDINSYKADIVCFQFAFIPVWMGYDIRKINSKICILHHGTDLNKAREDKIYLERLKIVWQYADKIIFVSHFLANEGFKLGCPKEKSLIHYLGVPISYSNMEYKKDSHIFKFVCVGRFVAVKNHYNLILAYKRLLDKIDIETKLTLIGSGELEIEIKNLVKKLNIEKSVEFMGEVDNSEVFNILKQSNCSILVSRVFIKKGEYIQEEGLPISLLEAATMRLPLIGSNTGGIPEIIDNSVNGYLVNPNSIEEIMNSMYNMAIDKNRAKNMGNLAYKKVRKYFDINVQNKKLEKIFLEVLNNEK